MLDGSTNDGFDTASLTPAWTGTPNASASVLNGTGVVGFTQDLGGAGVVYQSKDSPNHGISFARTLIKQSTRTGSYSGLYFKISDTSGASGISTGDTVSFLSNVRFSRSLPAGFNYFGHGGGSQVGTILPSASYSGGVWHSLSGVVPSVATANPSSGITIDINSTQPGDIIDIDNHYAIKGTYTGGYFDGSSPDSRWTGQPNNSISEYLSDINSTYTMRTPTSISMSGTTVSYTFRNNTYKELLDKTLELLPPNWYYRVGLGDNTVYLRERSSTPQHLFFLGKHIKALDLKGSIIDVVNHTLFTGGGDPALYVEAKEAPAPRTRRGLEVMSDSRVTLKSSADIIAEGKIEEANKLQYRTTVEVLTKQYDIESIQVGETIGFRNFGSFIDTLTLQIVGLSYTPDVVQLQLETKPPTINKRLSDIQRNLNVQESSNAPSTPS